LILEEVKEMSVLASIMLPPPSLKGIVASTRTEGAGAFLPSFIEKSWDEIGSVSW